VSKPVTLYHATMAESIPPILAKGLYPQMHTQWVGAAGQQLSEIGKVYAFTDRRDAIRLAFKLEWDTKRPTAVVTFASRQSDWEIDTHWESCGAFGWWLKSKGSWIKIPPADILATEELTPEMTRSVAAAGLPGKKKPWRRNPAEPSIPEYHTTIEKLDNGEWYIQAVDDNQQVIKEVLVRARNLLSAERKAKEIIDRHLWLKAQNIEVRHNPRWLLLPGTGATICGNWMLRHNEADDVWEIVHKGRVEVRAKDRAQAASIANALMAMDQKKKRLQ